MCIEVTLNVTLVFFYLKNIDMFLKMAIKIVCYSIYVIFLLSLMILFLII